MLPSSHVPGVCPGGMVMDEIDTCINQPKEIVRNNINRLHPRRLKLWTVLCHCCIRRQRKVHLPAYVVVSLQWGPSETLCRRLDDPAKND